jgi:hypothetical protein
MADTRTSHTAGHSLTDLILLAATFIQIKMKNVKAFLSIRSFHPVIARPYGENVVIYF